MRGGYEENEAFAPACHVGEEEDGGIERLWTLNHSTTVTDRTTATLFRSTRLIFGTR